MMVGKLRRGIERYGWFALARLSVYPIVLLFWMPYRLLVTLWNARVLANGRWSEYNRFKAVSGINSLFYWTIAYNIDRYGRSGISPHIGLGNFQLAKMFHVSLPSIYAYWRAGAVLPFASMMVWLAIHLLWGGGAVSWGWLFIIMVFATVSVKFYGASFVFLNYNAVGWAFFPLFLWGLFNAQHPVTAVALLGMSYGSITVAVISLPLVAVYAAECREPLVLAVVIPLMLKLATHFVWLVASPVGGGQSGVVGALQSMLKLIGATGKNVKYKYTSMKSWKLWNIYLFLIYCQFGLVLHFLASDSWLWWAGVLLYVVNTRFARFADPQSMFMMFFGLATALVIQCPSVLLLLSYWLVVSPLPGFVGEGGRGKNLDLLPPLKPFHVQPVIDRVYYFLESVKKGSRILMAYGDPQGVFEKVFDGYRTLLEVPSYVASLKGVHFFPDWWAVNQTNFPGSPNFWGRSVEDVLANVQEWQADYVIVYQETGTVLDNSWLTKGFAVVSELDWLVCSELLGHEIFWSGPTPKWWLLRTPGGAV